MEPKHRVSRPRSNAGTTFQEALGGDSREGSLESLRLGGPGVGSLGSLRLGGPGVGQSRIAYIESCDNCNLGAILCPKCPATGIACIDFKHRLGKFSGNVNVGRIFEEMLAN